VAEDGEVYAWKHLMVEAGVSPRLRRFHDNVWTMLLLLFVVAVALIVIGFFVFIFADGTLLAIAIALFVITVVAMVAATLHRQHLIAHVRWLDGTVTFHTVEPGGMTEDGQYVVCRVTTHPPTDITRVGTTIGILDAQHLAVGGTMRCLIDRNDGFNPLRVFPYAQPGSPLPSGRELTFQKA
jgi:uncharacterized membrane protein YfcA